MHKDVREKTYKDLTLWANTEPQDAAALPQLLKETKTSGLLEVVARFGFAYYRAEGHSQTRALRWTTLLEEACAELDLRLSKIEGLEFKLDRQRRLASPIVGE